MAHATFLLCSLLLCPLLHCPFVFIHHCSDLSATETYRYMFSRFTSEHHSLFIDPEMLNIGIARVRIPECCKGCQDSEDDDGSVCSCSTTEVTSDAESTLSAERLAIVHHVAPEALNESKWLAQSLIIIESCHSWACGLINHVMNHSITFNLWHGWEIKVVHFYSLCVVKHWLKWSHMPVGWNVFWSTVFTISYLLIIHLDFPILNLLVYQCVNDINQLIN